MNREIKFRAWSDRVGMKQVDQITIGENGWSCEQGFGVSIPYQPHVILMQFTGLKDKNGKEIYEGDIVQRGVITFSRGKFQGTYFDGNGSLSEDWEDDLYQEKNIEVRGNIYENPELLKDDEP